MIGSLYQSRICSTVWDAGALPRARNLSVALANTGGVDTSYNYSAHLRDAYLSTILTDSQSGVIEAGETVLFNYTLPAGLITGDYLLSLAYENLGTNETQRSLEVLSVSGLDASLSSHTDKTVYSTDEDITVVTNITNVGNDITGARLDLKIIGGTAPPPAPPQQCVVPTENLYINSDTVLCPGVYNLTSTGLIINADNVVVEGNNTVLVGPGSGSSYRGIYSYNRAGVTIKNIEVTNFYSGIYLRGNNNVISGNNLSGNKYGLYLYYARNSCFTNNTLNNNYDGVYFYVHNDNNTFTGNTILDSSHDGIYLESSGNNTFRNNEINGSSALGIYFGYNAYYNSFVNTTVNGHPFYHLVDERDVIREDLILEVPKVSNLAAVSLINCTNITLRNLTFRNHESSRDVFLYRSDNNTIEESNLSGGSSDGIALWYSSGNTIKNNAVHSMEPYWNGIELYYGSTNTVANNTITSASSDAISVLGSNANVIANNTANRRISINSANNNTITYNTVSNSTNNHGIDVSGNWNTITHNTVSNNTGTYAVGIACGGENNRISNNTLTANNIGISLSGYNNTITDNEINGSDEFGFNINLEYYYHSIVNNRVNGDIYYHLVNAQDIVLEDLILDAPKVSNLGKVSVINCTNITLRNLTVTNNNHQPPGFSSGIFGYQMNSSTIENCNASSNSNGIYLRQDCYNNNFTNNTISNNPYGIYISSSMGGYYPFENNRISNNTLTANSYGIYLFANNNTIIDNEINGSGLGFSIGQETLYNSIVNNHVNGDIYYHLVDERDVVLEDLVLDAPKVSNLGKVSIINCTNITLRNLTVTNNNLSSGCGIYAYNELFNHKELQREFKHLRHLFTPRLLL